MIYNILRKIINNVNNSNDNAKDNETGARKSTLLFYIVQLFYLNMTNVL